MPPPKVLVPGTVDLRCHPVPMTLQQAPALQESYSVIYAGPMGILAAGQRVNCTIYKHVNRGEVNWCTAERMSRPLARWIIESDMVYSWVTSDQFFVAPPAWPEYLRIPYDWPTPYELGAVCRHNMDWGYRDKTYAISMLIAWCYGLSLDRLSLMAGKSEAEMVEILQLGVDTLSTGIGFKVWNRRVNISFLPIPPVPLERKFKPRTLGSQARMLLTLLRYPLDGPFTFCAYTDTQLNLCPKHRTRQLPEVCYLQQMDKAAKPGRYL